MNLRKSYADQDDFINGFEKFYSVKEEVRYICKLCIFNSNKESDLVIHLQVFHKITKKGE